ncbi:hypothetical protein NDU88_001955 [Pleurodeles waltl]|uniref:Uncharacterized protein n=1 Tax=Pleurodeles waltl TaxID=8319 RepID=A0AAV7RAL5_PLEWA|nr:hypothetical protein NDU88_001955 [Pleurodeles waltl]
MCRSFDRGTGSTGDNDGRKRAVVQEVRGGSGSRRRRYRTKESKQWYGRICGDGGPWYRRYKMRESLQWYGRYWVHGSRYRICGDCGPWYRRYRMRESLLWYSRNGMTAGHDTQALGSQRTVVREVRDDSGRIYRTTYRTTETHWYGRYGLTAVGSR